MKTIISRAAALALLCFAAATHGAEPVATRVGSIVISDAWTRPTAEGMSMGVAYFIVRNEGDAADALIAARTTAAARVEFHQTTFADGMARMRPLKEIAVPARGRVAVEPNGIHLMLVGLTRALPAGTRVPLVLEFRRAGKVTVELVVASRAS